MPADELSQLFAAERAVRPPATTVERGLTRLLSDVAQAAPLPAVAGALKLTAFGVSKWVLAGFVVGMGGSGVALRASTESVPVSQPVSAPRTATPVAATLPIVAPEITHLPEPGPAPSFAAASLRAGPATRLAAGATVVKSEPVPFDAELRLITAAKAELDAGRAHLANVWLNEHAVRFPRGVFSTDRDALRVLARCVEHRDESSARAFVAQHPGSPMIPRLLRACRALSVAESANENPRLGEPTHE